MRLYKQVVCFLTVYTFAGTCHDSLDLDALLLAYYDADELDCPVYPAKFLDQILIPWGTPDRAHLSVPPQLRIAPSSIPGAGLGVFANTFIHKFTWLGEYEGEIITEKDQASDATWQIMRNGKPMFYVDAFDDATSNWSRFVNCARHSLEENVLFLVCRSRPFYMAAQDLYPGQELLVYYGDNYAKRLNIDTKNYYNRTINWELYKRYSCPVIQ